MVRTSTGENSSLDKAEPEHAVDTSEKSARTIHLLVANQELSARLGTVLAARGYEALWMRSSHEPLPSGRLAIVLADMDDCDPQSLTEMRRLRTGGNAIIALLTPGSAQTLQTCLHAGVDDFVFKPIRLDELQARITIAQSRQIPSVSGPGYPFIDRRREERRGGWLGTSAWQRQSAGVQIDSRGKRVLVDGRYVALSPKAFSILELLASDPGRVFSSEQIITHVWPGKSNATAEDVQQYIYLLRRRIGNGWLRTVKGFGYALAPASENAG